MCFDNKVNYLVYVIKNIGRLPEEEEFTFDTGEDLRRFFDDLGFLNMINAYELDEKPELVEGYNLILDTLDEYKTDLNETEQELITSIFRQKLNIKQRLDNEIYLNIKERKRLERQLQKNQRLLEKKIKQKIKTR